MPTNTLTDFVATLNINLFEGNAFQCVFIFPEGVVLPTVVETHAYLSKDGREVAAQFRPSLTLVGRELTLSYPKTDGMRDATYHQWLFDGRRVVAGTLSITKNTTLVSTPEPGIVLIQLADGLIINLPFSGDFYTSEYRNQALDARNDTEAFRDEVAQDAEQVADTRAYVESIAGNVVTYISQDEISVTFGLGGSITYTETEDSLVLTLL